MKITFTKALILILILILFLFCSIWLIGRNIFSETLTSAPKTLTLASNLISLDSSEGNKLLAASQAKNDFPALNTQFISQSNQAYCGVASMVMVLNSLKITLTGSSQNNLSQALTQDNFFNNENTKKIVTPEIVSSQGMTLDELAKLLESYKVKVMLYHTSDTTLEEFRKLAEENLKQPNNFIIVNYLRKEIGQDTGGHISPLAAYNQSTDQFLIMDVSRYKYPPVWVKTADLWKAMNTVDTASRKMRGFVFVSRE